MQIHEAKQARSAELDFLEERVAARAVPTSLAAIPFPSVDYKIDLDGAGGLSTIQVFRAVASLPTQSALIREEGCVECSLRCSRIAPLLRTRLGSPS